ncbi:MAG: helix-turn-helix domain-containing protein [Candidatus Liptonbacteria bacterium]|nr:helix-turn-helix domain-containing protein [Candidatus Liptonbacteria bacterium]
MRKEKQKAIELRRKGKSYGEISSALDVPKSTISDWFKDVDWSKIIKNKLILKSNEDARKRMKILQIKRSTIQKESDNKALIESRREFKKICGNPLFISGIMLYWGEGDKNIKNPIRLTNTDPRMINVYIKFLIEILKINPDKIKLGLIIYPDNSDQECKNFWSRSTASRVTFVKTQVINGRHPTKRLSHGICMVSTRNKYIKIKILEWIDLFYKKNIMV